MPMVTLPGGDLRDEVRNPLFDTIKLTAGQTLAGIRSFFTSLNRADGSPKSAAETNQGLFGQAGQLPTATSFRVQGMTIDASNEAAANPSILPVIMAKSSVALKMAQKDYWNGPLRFVAGRMLSEGVDFQQYGWPAIQPIVFQGRHTLDILPLQNFSLQWVIDATNLTATEAALTIAAGTEVSLVASLKGLLRRPVQ